MDAPKTSRHRWRSHEWNVVLVIAIIVALGLAWVGVEASAVRHRRAMREQIEATGARVWEFKEGLPPAAIVNIRRHTRDWRISTIRTMLGDEAVCFIGFNRQLTAAEREAVEAFPEADVDGVPDPLPTPTALP